MAQMTTTPVRTQGFYLRGKWVQEGRPVEIRAPYDGSPIAQIFEGAREHAELAIAAAAQAFGSTRKFPAFERQRVLRSMAARTEVERAIFTFTVAAEESTRIPGEYLSLDWQQYTAGRWGIVKRFPVG